MVSERAVTDALVAELVATGVAIGDGEQPSGTGWQGTPGQSSFVPYVVLHCISGGISRGTLDAAHADPEYVYQLSCHGATRAQAQFLADTTRPTVLGFRPALDGARVMFVDVDMEGGARRVDTVQPAQYQAVPRYRVYATPGPALAAS